MTIKTIIVDDEQLPRLLLSEKVLNMFPELEVVGEANNAETAESLIREKNPELVFLDIAMPGESGFDLIKKFPRPEFEVIFVTGFDEYAIDAIQTCAIGYVLKPIDDEMLNNAVQNAIERIQEKKENFRIQFLLDNLMNPGSYQNRIGIPTTEGLDFISIQDILRCEGDQKYTNVYLISGEKMLSSYNIGEFKRLLEKFNFYPTHKSHLVNLNHISKYNREGTLIMVDGSSVPVAKRKKADFLKMLTRV